MSDNTTLPARAFVIIGSASLMALALGLIAQIACDTIERRLSWTRKETVSIRAWKLLQLTYALGAVVYLEMSG